MSHLTSGLSLIGVALAMTQMAPFERDRVRDRRKHERDVDPDDVEARDDEIQISNAPASIRQKIAEMGYAS